jgi:hypothetical protein
MQQAYCNRTLKHCGATLIGLLFRERWHGEENQSYTKSPLTCYTERVHSPPSRILHLSSLSLSLHTHPSSTPHPPLTPTLHTHPSHPPFTPTPHPPLTPTLQTHPSHPSPLHSPVALPDTDGSSGGLDVLRVSCSHVWFVEIPTAAIRLVKACR